MEEVGTLHSIRVSDSLVVLRMSSRNQSTLHFSYRMYWRMFDLTRSMILPWEYGSRLRIEEAGIPGLFDVSLYLMCDHNTTLSSLCTDLLLVVFNRPIKVRDGAIVTYP